MCCGVPKKTKNPVPFYTFTSTAYLGPTVLLVVLALDGLTLRERRGDPDRGLAATAAAPLRCRFHGDARQPGRQDVFVAPRAVVRVYVIEDEAMDAAVAARPSCARRRRSIGPRGGDGGRRRGFGRRRAIFRRLMIC